MPKPDDPICSIQDCVVDVDNSLGLDISTAPRATAQRHYADEMGLDFSEVQCLRVYVHIYTRQEAWDNYGQEHEEDRRQMKLGVGWYYFSLPAGFSSWSGAPPPGVTKDGYYYDDPGPDGRLRPISDEDAAWIKGVPDVVPDDWEPDDGEPAWFRSHRDDPRAVPAWECSEF